MAGKTTVVAGAGGFIGGHLVAALQAQGARVRGVDVKPLDEWYQVFDDVENVVADLKLRRRRATGACDGAGEVYNLAADMGGMGFIENNKALCMLSVLINTHMLHGRAGARRRALLLRLLRLRLQRRQAAVDPTWSALKEEDAYPAMPEDGYGWEKLFSERMCRHFREDFGLETRVARFHNVYGPHGTWDGGREKAPAAICRKVIARQAHRQARDRDLGRRPADPQLHVHRRLRSRASSASWTATSSSRSTSAPSELVTINRLVDMVEDIAGVKLKRRYNLDAPKGVNGRNSDNTLIQKYLGWEPSIRLRDGHGETYRWIHDEYVAECGDSAPMPLGPGGRSACSS